MDYFIALVKDRDDSKSRLLTLIVSKFSTIFILKHSYSTRFNCVAGLRICSSKTLLWFVDTIFMQAKGVRRYSLLVAGVHLSAIFSTIRKLVDSIINESNYKLVRTDAERP